MAETTGENAMRKWLVGALFWLVIFFITLMGLGMPFPWHLGLVATDVATLHPDAGPTATAPFTRSDPAKRES